MALSITDPIHYSPVTRPHRRWLAWALSVLLHVLLIGGVAHWRFAPAPPVERTSLDVELVTRPAVAPEAAAAIAALNQQASGDEADVPPAERAAASHETPAVAVPDDVIGRVAEAEPVVTEPQEPAADEAPSVPEPDGALPSPPASQANGAPAASVPRARGRDLLAQATSSIRGQGFETRHAGPLDEDPSRRAARQAAEARYIDQWTRRVEDYGNRVYPAPAHLSGQLRIRVVIGREGQLLQAEVVQSSGHSELDQAALDTVHGAAPYRPFDRGMAGLDSLSISRVWRFGNGNNFGVQ
ncbi:energy transducer TonB [Litchfieldella rifensis]|uniref:TonB family protein n=1 Tax=Litchfieldella rifensis TaxID=762643 RepID=A0ABV7LNR3_9GAMM